jgi:hypothetical protein
MPIVLILTLTDSCSYPKKRINFSRNTLAGGKMNPERFAIRNVQSAINQKLKNEFSIYSVVHQSHAELMSDE